MVSEGKYICLLRPVPIAWTEPNLYLVPLLYMHTFINTYIQPIHTYIHKCIHRHMDIYKYTHAYTFISRHTLINTHVSINIHIQTFMHTQKSC